MNHIPQHTQVEMGMGKTVQSIALILGNMPGKQETKTKIGFETDTEIDGSKSSSSIDGKHGRGGSSRNAFPQTTSRSRPCSCTLVLCSVKILFCHRHANLRKISAFGHHRPRQVVAPMSLLSQWRDEFAKYSQLRVGVYYGKRCDLRSN